MLPERSLPRGRHSGEIREHVVADHVPVPGGHLSARCAPSGWLGATASSVKSVGEFLLGRIG